MSAGPSPFRVTLPMVVRGAAVGAVAYVLGYVVTYLTAVDAARAAATAFQPLAGAGGRLAPAWKVAGWAFYDAHFVGTTFAGRTVDLVALAGVEYLYLVPPAVLLLAGGSAAALANVDEPRRGLVSGMAVTVGYLPLVVVLAALVAYARVGPSLLRALVVAGLVYPVAFGSIGGAFAAVVMGDRSTT